MLLLFRIIGLPSVLCFALLTATAVAQKHSVEKDFEPRVGQAGKDVVWVPTPHSLVEKMLDTAKVTPNDYVIDLGSGDGRTVIAAAKRGARALGIEYNAGMVELSKRNAVKENVSDKASFVQSDIFASDFSQATVITMFLLPDLNLKLRSKLLDLSPGTRIVSNTFSMGAWLADRIISVEENCQDYCIAYFWIVPAKIEGRWLLSQGELQLRQLFQRIGGTITAGGGKSEALDGVVEGKRINFTAGGVEYIGHVEGRQIDGVARTATGMTHWIATRAIEP